MTIFLETDRLFLRPLDRSQFDNISALRSDPDVMQFGGVQTQQEINRYFEMLIQYQSKHGIGIWSVFEKDKGDFIGQAGLFHLEYDDSKKDIEVAYRLHKMYWGKGYATELTKALIRWGFQHLSIQKILGVVDSNNHRSIKVLVKSGLHYIKMLEYKGQMRQCYQISKSDYRRII